MSIVVIYICVYDSDFDPSQFRTRARTRATPHHEKRRVAAGGVHQHAAAAVLPPGMITKIYGAGRSIDIGVHGARPTDPFFFFFFFLNFETKIPRP